MRYNYTKIINSDQMTNEISLLGLHRELLYIETEDNQIYLVFEDDLSNGDLNNLNSYLNGYIINPNYGYVPPVASSGNGTVITRTISTDLTVESDTTSLQISAKIATGIKVIINPTGELKII